MPPIVRKARVTFYLERARLLELDGSFSYRSLIYYAKMIVNPVIMVGNRTLCVCVSPSFNQYFGVTLDFNSIIFFFIHTIRVELLNTVSNTNNSEEFILLRFIIAHTWEYIQLQSGASRKEIYRRLLCVCLRAHTVYTAVIKIIHFFHR